MARMLRRKGTHWTPWSNSWRRPGAVRSSWPKVEWYPSLRKAMLCGSRAFCTAADAFESFATRFVMDTSSEDSGYREPCRCICGGKKVG